MGDEELYETAISVAQSFPSAQICNFADGWEAARVGGKWFMLSTFRGRQIITVKATPDDVLALTAAYPFITRGYHMNKKHWVSIHAGIDVPPSFVRELITDSYQIIVSSLPHAIRP